MITGGDVTVKYFGFGVIPSIRNYAGHQTAILQSYVNLTLYMFLAPI